MQYLQSIRKARARRERARQVRKTLKTIGAAVLVGVGCIAAFGLVGTLAFIVGNGVML